MSDHRNGAHRRFRPRTAVPTDGRPQHGNRQAVSTGRLDHEQGKAIRAWARAQGLIVGTRGKLPDDVVEAFHRAHS